MYDNLLLLKDIVDYTSLPIAVYMGDELQIELANPAMIKIWGKGDRVIGMKYIEVLPEIQKQQIFNQALTVLKTGTAFHARDAKIEMVNNEIVSIHYFNYSFLPLSDKTGKIYGVMNTGADVTDLHLAKKQVQSTEERLRIAIESSGMGTYEIDLASKKVKTSGNFNAIWSHGSETANEELLAKMHSDDRTVSKKASEWAEFTGKIDSEVQIINNDGSIRWVRVNGKIIKDEKDQPATIIGIVQNIHKQKEFEQELKRQVTLSTEELKRSNDDLLHFANVVSHDLREPVRKIQIFNSLLRNEKRTKFNENATNYLNKIEQSSQRMNNIIEGILAYSTLDKTKQPVESIDLNETVENIKIDLELIIKEKGAIFVSSELPEIEGAQILINQLFYNLIQNALKFSKADQHPRVIISCSIVNRNGNDSAQIAIRDNGIGLDTAFVEKIFTAFERLHSKDQYEGNGLGLALCRKITERHRGTITAAGEKDNGAEFTITLPLKQQTDTI
jgi:PAS domain S-box-containing protein